MGALLSKCCCTCLSKRRNRNSIGVVPEQRLKILLLGLSGSGKTEVAHKLTTTNGKVKRSDFEATNGSKYYQTQMQLTTIDEHTVQQSIGITEIGGSQDMQRIWHHYYAGTMAIAYCFDMSASYARMCETFQLFDKVLTHSFVRGKSILLIGTKSDLVDEGLQLYDIENTFHLSAVAQKYGCKLRICHTGNYEAVVDEQSLSDGFHWLAQVVRSNYGELQVRIKGDTNMKTWQEQTQKLIAAGKMKRWSYRRFPNKTRLRARKQFWKYVSIRNGSARVRPNTAPALYTISYSSQLNILTWQRQLSSDTSTVDTADTAMTVPNDITDINGDIALTTQSKQMTDV